MPVIFGLCIGFNKTAKNEIMITQVIKQLQSDNWYNVSEEVEFAKGRFEIPTSKRKHVTRLKRMWNSNKIYK